MILPRDLGRGRRTLEAHYTIRQRREQSICHLDFRQESPSSYLSMLHKRKECHRNVVLEQLR